MFTAIASLWRPFLGKVLAGQALRVGDRIDLDKLAKCGRVFQAARDVAVAQEGDVGVQAAAALKRRDVKRPQTMLDL
jgi:hypothetical protein